MEKSMEEIPDLNVMVVMVIMGKVMWQMVPFFSMAPCLSTSGVQRFEIFEICGIYDGTPQRWDPGTPIQPSETPKIMGRLWVDISVICGLSSMYEV